MTKKDFEAIAVALGQAFREAPKDKSAEKTARLVAEHLSHAFQIDNRRFSPARFVSTIRAISHK